LIHKFKSDDWRFVSHLGNIAPTANEMRTLIALIYPPIGGSDGRISIEIWTDASSP
jgi:hypothetical protein